LIHKNKVQKRLVIKKKYKIKLNTHMDETNNDVYDCIAARSVLMLPVVWGEPSRSNIQTWVNGLLSRSMNYFGKDIYLWKENFHLPKDIYDLDPHFTIGLGIDENLIDISDNKYFETEEICRRLILNDEAKKVLFPKPALVGVDKESQQSIEKIIEISKIEIIAFPLGVAILLIHINWIIEETMTVDELRTWIYLAKFRHKVDNIFNGWLLDTSPKKKSYSSSEIKSMSKPICKSLFDHEPCSLSAIGNWLLCTSFEETEKITQKIRKI